MNWGVTGILIVLGGFILILIFNPNLSCFGKRLKSPLYPFYRKKKMRQSEKAKPVKTEDYGFHLTDDGDRPNKAKQTTAPEKTEDYDFKLD